MGSVMVFKDTRLAVSQLFGVLRDGGTLSDFLELYDTPVTEDDVKAVLSFLEADLIREWAAAEERAKQEGLYSQTPTGRS